MKRLKVVLLAGLLLAAAGALNAQDETAPPPAGTWKVTLPTLEETAGFPLVLVKFEKSKNGKWEGSVVAAAPKFTSLKQADVSTVSVTEKVWRFTIKSNRQTLSCDVNLGKDLKAKKFFGEMRDRGDVLPLEIERTNMAAIDRFEIIKEEIATEPLGIRAAHMARLLLSVAEEKKVKASEARAWADKAVKSATVYGPAVLRNEQLMIAQTLAEQSGYEKTALQYAQYAEANLDEKTEGPVATKRVLDVLASVQEKAGKKDDAALTQMRIKKLNFPIKTNKFAGRKGKGDRVVLAELFTTAQTKSVIPSDAAVQALQKTFKTNELTVLLYHQHLPMGNPLGSPEGEERLSYYAGDVRSLPTLILNGRVAVKGGGGPEDSQERYDEYFTYVEELLEAETQGQLTLTTVQKGGKIEIGVKGKLEEANNKVRLRVAVVEKETTYRGKSGAAVHYSVVRAMPGGSDGIEVKGKAVDKTFTIDLAELRKKLEKYQEDVNKKRPFPDKEKPLELKELRVVAFLQNDETKEVLQAVQADVN